MKINNLVNKARKHANISKYVVWYDTEDGDYCTQTFYDYNNLIAFFDGAIVNNYIYTENADKTIVMYIYT